MLFIKSFRSHSFVRPFSPRARIGFQIRALSLSLFYSIGCCLHTKQNRGTNIGLVSQSVYIPNSVSFRYWIRSTMLVNTRPCCLQKRFISGSRIISVGCSSETISQRIPARDRPARWARSIPASVWPSRAKTPPSRALSGKMCPGRTKSSAVVSILARRFIVLARSTELIPVVMPDVKFSKKI